MTKHTFESGTYKKKQYGINLNSASLERTTTSILMHYIILLLKKNGNIWQGNIEELKANLGFNVKRSSYLDRKLRLFGIDYGIKVTFLDKARKRIRLELLQNLVDSSEPVDCRGLRF